ncbi:TRAP transporter large permease [Cryobacterium levicorallinum]|uniref:TRAP transporter large permease n=1 Tax=Cryobacterium levicorallinum TaxID=995038 RepID=A0A1I3AP73_9MICO|nr:TRAP transporter large permease [Cryobacterium levicorallinum]TFB88053.1 TRAP transporter large permease [Cryobacterium levicorallinum]GEP26748.1 C4-dicarboxylate ABC transporter [Cryobacterium levicorallinum]SFH51958.1 TRAP transporter, DctM subunit [Cryobacterium levicorallinum]
MEPLLQGAIIAAIALAAFLLGMPIAFALGFTSIVSIWLFLGPSQVDLFGKFVFDSTNDFGLLAIPLFVLMGNVFGGSTVSKHLFEAGEAWLSRVRGGLAMSSIVASAVFAAISGSSSATAAAIGGVAVPEMEKRGYSQRVAAGAVAAGGTLGILIPPSVTLILYGIASEESIGQLFAAGVIPGIIITVMFCVWIYIATGIDQRRATRIVEREFAVAAASEAAAGRTMTREAEPSGTATSVLTRQSGDIVAPTYSWPTKWTALVKVLPFVFLIVAVLGTLYAGVATPSEAAAVGVVLVLLLVGVAYRGLKGKQFLKILLDTTNQSTMILMITAFSGVIALVLSFLRVPQELASIVTELDVNKWVVMIVINLVLLVMGLFLPPVSIVVMVTPILYPLIMGLGFDPIWFGIIMTINMEVGLITPPVGLNLYVLKGILPHIALKDIIMGSLPYVGVLGLAIALFSFFPSLITWLPDLLY